MPFVYRGKPVKMNRTKRKEDSFIHENVLKALDSVSQKENTLYVPILPVFSEQPSFSKANPEKFLVPFCVKLLGLSMYDVEHWLDNISYEKDFYLTKLSSVLVDERKMCYKKLRRGMVEGFSNRVLYLKK